MSESRVTEFLERLGRLSKGDQTALKRSLGQTLQNSSGSAQAAFYKAHYGAQEQAYFVAATIVCYFGLERMTATRNGSMGEALKRLKYQESREDSNSMDNKLAAILDVRMDVQAEYLCAKIGRIVRMLKQKECIPNYETLVVDIVCWDHESRFVQRKWAKDYYSVKTKEGEKSNVD